MASTKIVVRYADGRVVKGFTADFMPNKEMFHVTPAESQPAIQVQTVNVKECKALFFVKDHSGNPAYNDKQEFDPGRTTGGRKIRVVFKDKETLIGTTQGYQPGRPGFFLFPADPKSNMNRCFVVSSAAQEISFL